MGCEDEIIFKVSRFIKRCNFLSWATTIERKILLWLTSNLMRRRSGRKIKSSLAYVQDLHIRFLPKSWTWKHLNRCGTRCRMNLRGVTGKNDEFLKHKNSSIVWRFHVYTYRDWPLLVTTLTSEKIRIEKLRLYL